MSLFPAYKKKFTRDISKSPELEVINDEPSTSWLENSSFQPDFIRPRVVIISSSDSSDCEVIESTVTEVTEHPIASIKSDSSDTEKISSKKSHSRSRKKSKKHKKSEKHQVKVKYEPVVENLYFDDKHRDKGNFKVDTLCSRVRPLYRLGPKTLGFIAYKFNKKEALKRYYLERTENKDKPKKKSTVIQKTKIRDEDEEELLKELNEKMIEEEEIKKLKIKEFNEKLAEDPQDVNLWIEYINFSERDTETMKYQRKLAITEKALEKNPNSKELLKEKLKFMNELVPADQYSNQIEAMISKDPRNVVLWQALITATRSSVAMCTTPKVINLYSKCFASLHLWSRTCSKTYDDSLLSILNHSLVFLRHAGLWEQMWEIIRLNLNLNLSISKDSHYFRGSIDEKKLIGMEEVILTSRLPLNQLWLRVELLRENCHWLSVTRDQLELVGDSHRFISPEDVTEFVHPLLSKESNFKMAIYVLIALKIPLLPTRHHILKDLNMEENNWSFDSLESLIPMIYPCVGEMAGYKQRNALSIGLFEGGVTSGPQYLHYHPAQEPYLDFVRDAFRIIAESLPSENKSSIYIWWLRFERMLLSFYKKQSIRIDKGSKKLKGILKDFLKKDENRNNLHYYREYALVEREMGRLSNCINILETAIQTKGNVVETIRDKIEQTALLSLYRSLLEVLFDIQTWEETNRGRILKVFSQMSSGENEDECLIKTEKYLYNCYKEFLQDPNALLLEESIKTQFLPNFYCDAITCYVYLLFINSQDLEKIYRIFDECLTINSTFIQERLHESKIAFLQLIFERSLIKLNTFQEHLNKAMKCCPDNFYILSVFAGIESELPHWNTCLRVGNSRLWVNIAQCLAGRARLHAPICLNEATAMSAALNRLLHFHKRLSRNSEIRCCPLVWRLYMLLLREQNLCEKKGEEVYHESVAYCPWARCIYIDAAEIAPQLLTQIQDVIREKDLRMHVTPEELDILRG